MSGFWKRLLALGFAVILGTGLLALVYVVPVLITEVDPNLMKGQCPGGKDWDLPGSSCHDGLIFDSMPLIAPAKSDGIVVKKKKRGR
jgi:hypothetical protein